MCVCSQHFAVAASQHARCDTQVLAHSMVAVSCRQKLASLQAANRSRQCTARAQSSASAPSKTRQQKSCESRIADHSRVLPC